ncbi:hypothetical protein AB832_01455 [Flavobacteriaceae bacterium (ex Bugula neritina AB1)]|nr:hypothetical protein AB832_01455 [Flavobacteriaceae bacterium (ex Bugula neritina AB1)]
MKKFIFLLIILGNIHTIISQRNVILKDSIELKADQFLGIDSFDAIYYTKENVFYKKWRKQEWQFSDFILGPLTSVSILNPLKILLFYESSNTMVIVDKYLTEIDRINFNTISEFKNASHVSAANDSTIWVFDNNTQQLEVFDTSSRKTIATTPPISQLPLQQVSNFNYCWLLTPDTLYQFNIYGSILYKMENSKYQGIKIMNNNLILLKEGILYHFSTNDGTTEKIKLPEITVKQFYVTHEILYIYHLSKIYSFDLTSPKK